MFQADVPILAEGVALCSGSGLILGETIRDLIKNGRKKS